MQNSPIYPYVGITVRTFTWSALGARVCTGLSLLNKHTHTSLLNKHTHTSLLNNLYAEWPYIHAKQPTFPCVGRN